MNKNDVMIKELRGRIDAQRKELGTCERFKLITNGIFITGEVGNKPININTINNIDVLIHATKTLVDYVTNYEKACELLEVDFDKTKLKIDGYTFDEWITDFKARVRIIEWNNQKRKLDDAVKKLENLMSEEAKTESELENLKNILGI